MNEIEIENRILMKELHRYRELEKKLEKKITLQELVETCKDDILHYGENAKGLRMLSKRDFQYYLDVLEEKSNYEYNFKELKEYQELEKRLIEYGTTVEEIVFQWLEKRKGKEE